MEFKIVRKKQITKPSSEGFSEIVTEGYIGTYGICPTKHGFVWVMSRVRVGGNLPDKTVMQFIYNGVRYDTRLEKHYKPRYLTTLANNFAKEICESQK